jgi:hypothetical protein
MLGWAADWRLSDQGRDHAWSRDRVSFDDAFWSGMRGTAAILSGHGPAN